MGNWDYAFRKYKHSCSVVPLLIQQLGIKPALQHEIKPTASQHQQSDGKQIPELPYIMKTQLRKGLKTLEAGGKHLTREVELGTLASYIIVWVCCPAPLLTLAPC